MKYDYRILNAFTALILFTFVSCKMFSGASSDNYVVESEVCEAADTSIVDSQNGTKLKLITNVSLTVPDVDMNNEKLASLYYNVYCGFIFDTDSMTHSYSMQELAPEMIAYLKSRFVGVDAEYSDADSVYTNNSDNLEIKCNFIAGISYNDNGIISLLKEIETEFAGNETIKEKFYLNCDIAHGNIIDNSSLFGDENAEMIVSLIRQQLLRDNGARSEQQLIDLGFFNLDNISLANNFTFTPKGIKWVYRPLELGCFALGYVSVELPYSDIAPYVVSEDIDLSAFE